MPDPAQLEVYRNLNIDWKKEYPTRKSFMKS